MPQSLTTDARFAAAFAQIAAIIRKETHNDASLFRMLADIVPHNATFAYALGMHIADVLDGHQQGGDVAYTEVLVEAYRRTLFDPLAAAKHGPDYFDGDPERAEDFARTVRTYAYLDARDSTLQNAIKHLH